MLEKIKVNQIQHFYRCLVKEIIVSGLAIKQEIQTLAMDDLVECMVQAGNG